MGSGFTGDWDGLPPQLGGPLTLDQAQAAARVLQDELGLGWRVEAVQYPEGARLVAQKWPPGGEGPVTAPTLEAARKRIAEREGTVRE